MNGQAARLVQQFYRDEMGDLVTYTALADGEKNPKLRDVLTRSAGMEQRHAGFWKRYLESRGATVPSTRRGGWRLRLLTFLQRFFNPVLLVATLELGESRALKQYFECLKTLGLSDDEKAALRRIILEEIEHEVTFRRESRSLGLEHVRDFVLGMNDGLIEVLGVVTGLSAVYASTPTVVAVSGLIVGIAGALSMAIGAFISVRSQRQVNQGTRERMEVLFEVAPERAVDEYRDKLTESGVPDDTADEIARRVGVNRDAISRLLLAGGDENEFRSGALTGLAYLGGAAFPLVPYFMVSSSLTALAISLGFAAFALCIVAAAISLFSGISLKRKALEMVTASMGAAALSYAFGLLLQRYGGGAP